MMFSTAFGTHSDWIPGNSLLHRMGVIPLVPVNIYSLPRTVMATAATPANESESLRLSLNISGDPSQKLYMYMHFAEVEKLNEGELREFTISLNDDESWGGGALTPPYLSSDTLYSTNSVSGSTTNKLLFTIKKTGRSTRPPIINSMEVYKIKDFSQSSTLQGDGMFLSMS